MITIDVKKENDCITFVSIHGHAMYDAYGKDIVCAAVSSIVMTSINNALSLNENALSYRETDGKIEIYDIQTKECETIMQNMVTMLSDLQRDYPKNIKIRNEESKR